MISPIGAKLTRDTDTFTKMDPYCEVVIGTVKKKTKPHSGGGKTPKWKGYTWSIPVDNNSQEIKINIFDDDTMSDDFVGGGTLNVRDLKSFDKLIDVPILYKKKNIGTCQLRMRFEPKQASFQQTYASAQ